MATPLSSHLLPSFSSQSRSISRPFLFPSSLSFPSLRSLSSSNPRKFLKTPFLALSSNNFDASPFHDAFGSNPTPSKKSVLANLIQEIEPLDVSLIQKDVSPMTVDAMKRTISGMLGLLPSDRFQVFIEALWEPLSKLLVSSMMTGYTLRNAEYRLCLERNLGCEGDLKNRTSEKSNFDLQEMLLDRTKMNEFSEKNDLSSYFENTTEDQFEETDVKGLGEMSLETQNYILHLKSRITAVKKELREVKRKNAALQMQQFVGEEKNDLLDYLRSLQPEKVAELSEPTSPELKETIHSVVHGLLATLSPRMHSKVPPLSENTTTGTVNIGSEDCTELVENTSLQFQPFISLTRDYLARLLFWCMLLGHYLRGLEYRMELMELLSLTSSPDNNGCGDEQGLKKSTANGGVHIAVVLRRNIRSQIAVLRSASYSAMIETDKRKWNFHLQPGLPSVMPPSCRPFSATFKLNNLSPSPFFAVQFLHSVSSTSSSSHFHNLSVLLQGRISHSHLLQIHSRVFRLHAHQDNLIATRLIGHYSSPFAFRVFNQLRNPNIFPFNAIIRVLAENGLFFLAFSLFNTLKQRSLSPNDLTFSFLLKACFRSNNAQYVKQIHTHILKLGYLCDSTVCCGLLAVYAKGFKDLVSAHNLFDGMLDKGLVTPWTNLIAGYAQSGRKEEVLRLFCAMIEKNLQPENDTMVSVLSACSNLEIFDVEKWALILSEVTLNSDNTIQNRNSVNIALIYLHGRLGNVEKSRERFNEIDTIGKRSVLLSNAMLGAYVQNGCPIEALSLFHLMMEDYDCRPNHVTMVSVLSACAQIGDLDLGKWVHQYMECKGRKGVLETNTFLATAFIDMYSKCGDLEMAKRVFHRMISKDVVSFNAMIMGLAMNGEGQEAVSLFSKMQDFGLCPNAGTFLGLLCACNHSGLSEEGRQIFIDMNSRFSVPPRLEHYACYIDILARVGLVDEALKVVDSMPYEPNNFVWGALLGGCVLHSRADLAEKVYKKLVEVDPHNSGGYVMLANTLAVDHRWNDVSVLRWLMREKGVKKQPGHSWISIDGVVHEFLAGPASHPQIDIIYHTLNGLVNVMKVSP
ncbi:hypothetical protein DITRI_Ditri01bG0070300 [Diplodiscus trichospermus]